MTFPVYLNVYDLHKYNDYGYFFGIGAFHSGVEFLGRGCCCFLISFNFSLIQNRICIWRSWHRWFWYVVKSCRFCLFFCFCLLSLFFNVCLCRCVQHCSNGCGRSPTQVWLDGMKNICCCCCLSFWHLHSLGSNCVIVFCFVLFFLIDVPLVVFQEASADGRLCQISWGNCCNYRRTLHGIHWNLIQHFDKVCSFVSDFFFLISIWRKPSTWYMTILL